PNQQYLVLSSRQTGANQTFSATSSTLTEDASRAVVGQDAAYSVNGTAKASHSNVVTDGIPGISLTLKGVTGPGVPVTVTIGAPTPNEAAISDKVKSFVDTYNSTIAFIQGKVQEKPVANPQTAGDAAAGVLHSDPGRESLISSMRNAMTNQYAPGNPATLDQLLEVGVSTGAAVGSGTLDQAA